jgi:acyl-coenzyme A thioesterase PaaI-like protein
MTQSAVGKSYGVIDDDRKRAMSGLEFVQGLVDGTLPLNSMAETLGYDIVEVAKGRVVAAATPNERHRNPAGTVHGGVVSCGRRVGTAEGKLTDKDGRVLAHGTTTCLIYAH